MPRRPPHPAPHPAPPRELRDRPLPLLTVSGPWARIHRASLGPLFFGRTGGCRFDAPDGSFGVLYVAASPAGAFIETFGWVTGTRVISEQRLGERRLCDVYARRPVKVVDLAGPGLAVLGADARLGAGPHPTAQRWSRALHDHPDAPDGLLYRSRHDPGELCLALFERASAGWLAQDRGALDSPALAPVVGGWLDRYGFGLVQ